MIYHVLCFPSLLLLFCSPTFPFFRSNTLLIHSYPTTFFSFATDMCRIVHYKFCFNNPTKLPPKDEIIRCSEWPQLELDARAGDPEARRELRSHIQGMLLIVLFPFPCRNREVNNNAETQKDVETELIHVSEKLPGGTCVPDKSDAIFHAAGRGRSSADTDV